MVFRLSALALATLMAAASVASQQDPKDDARKGIADSYAAWDTASVAGDMTALGNILAPDFTSVQGDRKANKDESIKALTQTAKIAKTLSLSTRIFTLTQKGDQWIAVISEKLEANMTVPKAGKVYAQFVYRDSWRQVGKTWQLVTSEGIGSEFWRNAAPSDWNS